MSGLPKIIAICGYKGSGKDTIANYLVKKYKYTHYKIAEKLKEVIKLLFNLSDSDLETSKDKINQQWNVTPRKILQFIGTDMFQYKLNELFPKIQKNFWIKSLFTNELINKIKNEDHKIVISDLRFLHEYNLISNLYISYSILKVDNNNIQKKDTHISENEFNNIPINSIINNNKSVTELYNIIDKNIKIMKLNNNI
tara:strand:- start:7 stop:597 length:591 start_codon:yes stop_codon:yes gene_type:complete